jgi:hypothetical protein
VKLVVVFAAAFAVLVGTATARGHVGMLPAVAKFTAPAEPVTTHVDPNDTFTWSGFANADASYTIQWTDGDIDPTGRFTFYYMDHEPTFQVGPDEIEQTLGHKIVDGVNDSGGYFASCICSTDLGVTCPPDIRDPNGNCANQLVWNTSGLAPGTYWLVAVNNDPPYHTWNVSGAPVRVVHGGTPPPAAIILRPDGFGAFDKGYHLQWLGDGKAPLRFDLAYGLEDTGAGNTIIGDIGSGVSATDNGDGSFGYDWDISQLPSNKAFWVRLTVTDADGQTSFTDSKFAVTVFHSGATAMPDLAMAPPPKGGCHCSVENHALAPGRDGLLAALFVLGGLGAVVYLARRAGRRG